MSIDLTGNPGGWFKRLGLEIGEMNRVASACFGAVLDTAVSGLFGQHVSNEQQQISQLYQYRDTVRQQASNYVSQLQAQAVAVAVAQVDRSSPLPPGGKTAANAAAAVISQMKANGDSIQRATTSAVASAASGNKGDALLKLGLTDQYGLPLDLVFAETLTATVTGDTGNGGATKYREPITVVGQPTREFWDYRWPAGSGGSVSFNISDAADTSRNEVLNGDFASWGGTGNNTPASWSALTGAFGTQVLRGSTSPLRSADGTAYFLRMSSDGSTLTAVGQAVALDPLTVYCLHLFARINSLDSGGSLVVKLIDGNGTTVQDDAGTDLSYTRNTNGQIGTSFTSVSAFWATPRIVPSGTRLSIGLGASPTTGRTVDIALVALVPATQLYPGGPYAAAFSKESQSAKNDSYSVAVANNLTRWSFARSLDGLFNLRANGLSFPSAASPSVSDNLITSAS